MAKKETANFLLDAQDVRDFLDDSRVEPDKSTEILHSSVDQLLDKYVKDCLSPNEMRCKLNSVYADSTVDVKKKVLRRFLDFCNAKHIQEYNKICKELENTDNKPPDATTLSKLESSLRHHSFAISMAKNCAMMLDRKKDQAENDMSSLALQVDAFHIKPKLLDAHEQTDEKKKENGKQAKFKPHIRSRITTMEQFDTLQRKFMQTRYICIEERMKLASSLNLTAHDIKIWFENRRAKFVKANSKP